MPRDAARVTPARYRAVVLAVLDRPAGLARDTGDALGACDCAIGGAILDQIRVAVADDAANLVSTGDITALISTVLYAAQSAKSSYAADLIVGVHITLRRTSNDR